MWDPSSKVMDLLAKHPVVGSISMATSVVIASEVIWALVKYIRRKSPRHEVVVFNELGEMCAFEHMRSGSWDSPCRNKHCSNRNLGRLIREIDAAVYSIDMAIYLFTHRLLANAFKRALQRGVLIRVIGHKEYALSSGSQIGELADFGVPVRGPHRSSPFIMHHKFCVIDGVQRVEELRMLWNRKYMRPSCSVLVTGSVNWTCHGFSGNRENFIITDDEQLVGKYQAEFQRLWLAFESRPGIIDQTEQREV
ncbi:hypothetical protein KR009_004663 [Drosophila setifemur]|nr:hypothetical protein KR009_004663 [Drosophila setifemur]